MAARPDTAAPAASVRRRGRLALYAELAKARLSSLVVATTAVGFVVSAPRPLDLPLFFWTVLGTALSAAGANGLNQWLERERDARMQRTCTRPLPSHALSPLHALLVSLLWAFVGVLLLALFVNGLTAALSALVIVIYVLLYTPLKVRSSLNTQIGAVCGAIPPMMGWSAATGAIDAGAYILGAVLFVWQIPHFLALAWLYRDDYERGGYRMLPHADRSGRLTSGMVLLYSLALIPVALMAAVGGLAGSVYATAAIALGLAMSALAWRLVRERSDRHAKRVFLASLLYLPILLGVMVADRGELRAPVTTRSVPAPVVAPAAPTGAAGLQHAALVDDGADQAR